MRRRSNPFVKYLSCLLIIPVLIIFLIATGLLVSLAFLYFTTSSYADSSNLTIHRLPHLTPTPSGAMVAEASSQPDAASAAPVSVHAAEPASRQGGSPSPTLLTRLINLIFGAPTDPTALVIQRLPPLTPTPFSAEVVQAADQPEAFAAVPTTRPVSAALDSDANQTPSLPPSNPPAAPLATSEPQEPDQGMPGWSFVGVQTLLNEGEAVVKGVLINNTGSPQEAVEVSGVFYDAQGQAIQEQVDTSSYIPVDIIPIGGHIPFEMDATSPTSISRIELQAQSTPAADTPRQDFQFVDLSQWTNKEGQYCLGGQVQNLGATLQDYLVILGTIYNSQGKLVGFSDNTPTTADVLEGGKSSPFELCVDSLNQQVTRHELNAMGY